VKTVTKRLIPLLVLAVSVLLMPAAAANAQQSGAGLRAGVSANPDQFYFGGHFDTGYIVDRLSFRPNVEIGLGSGLTSVAGNFEFVYWWAIPNRPWHVYAGGGPGVNVARFNAQHGDRTDIGPAFNIVGGIAHSRGLFFEVKLGLIHNRLHPEDLPEPPTAAQVKFGVGYTWK